MTTLNQVKEFLDQKHIAIAGISRKSQKFGNAIFKELQKKNYKLYPIHREMTEFEGTKCYPDVKSLPPEVSALVICTQPAQSVDLMNEAIAKKIRHVWLQQGAQNDESISLAEQNQINLIQKECVLMFAEPSVFIHRFHRGINKIFGKLPK